MSETVINVNHVSKLYKIYNDPMDRLKESLLKKGEQKLHSDYYALSDLDFSVDKGEIVGIVGKNGSGKSTILKILTGVLNPSKGNVELKGKVAALLELGAGFNSEYLRMKNIYLHANMMRESKEDIEKKIPEILEFADIGDYINQPVKTYSSGMFVRLAFAVAINVDPDILIVDEALSVGDARFQLKCMEKFSEFVKAGKTILFVTHDINAVKRFCNRAIWLNQGKLIMDGNTNEVTDRYMDFLKSDLSIDDYINHCKEDDDKKESQIAQLSKTVEVEKIEIAEIMDFKIYDELGREIDNINHGKNVRVRILYAVNDVSIKNPAVGVAIRRIDNEYICGLNTKLDGYEIPWNKGINEIWLEYKDFNLVGGEYYFDAAILDKTTMVYIDYKAKVKSFFVNMDYVAEGVVALNHGWNNN
ncbi:MAG: ABC transporter ATP-binding protein [Lachnospiraceae bacterium]|nr:ABC transporter ATP-binding protein [Lachnospiraceae bacterium]